MLQDIRENKRIDCNMGNVLTLEEAKARIHPTSTNKELETIAVEVTRSMILKECEEAGLTVKKIVSTIVESLDAKGVKQQFNPVTMVWEEAPAQIDHASRLKAVVIGKDIVGMDAPKQIRGEIDYGFKISPETQELVEKLIGGMVDFKVSTSVQITANFAHFSPQLEED